MTHDEIKQKILKNLKDDTFVLSILKPTASSNTSTASAQPNSGEQQKTTTPNTSTANIDAELESLKNTCETLNINWTDELQKLSDNIMNLNKGFHS